MAGTKPARNKQSFLALHFNISFPVMSTHKVIGMLLAVIVLW